MSEPVKLKPAEVKWAKVIGERCGARGVGIIVFGGDEAGITVCGADKAAADEMALWKSDMHDGLAGGWVPSPELGE